MSHAVKGISLGAFVVAFSVAAWASSARWYEFKGLYVGMPAAEAKKLGIDKCKTDEKPKIFDETCEPGPNGNQFQSIGGARIQNLEIVIEKGKVGHIHIESVGLWDDFIPIMKQHYGKPKKETRTTVTWDRGGAEYILAFVQKGIVNIEFHRDENGSDQAIKARTDKARKDF
jgi:hypothetical protein